MAVEKKVHSFSDIRNIGAVSQDGVFVFDLSEKIFTYVSPVLVQIFEINRELLLEEPGLILQLIDAADHEYLNLRYAELLQTGVIEGVQIKTSQRQSEKVVSINAYLVAGRTSVIGFVRDVTKEKEHEDYLINFGARKDAILDMVSQNLSTPLNLSSFTVNLIEKAVAEKKYHKLDSHIKLMREITSDCIRIIDDFLQEEHLVSPSIHPRLNRFDVVAKTMVVLEKLRAASPAKQFRIKSQKQHLVIHADDVKYFQIIHNLLSNAIKFTRPNGVIQVSIRERETQVEIQISDDGIGIPEPLRPFLFQRKSRAARPGLKGEVSNGIGLFVVNELTKLMNGRISVESKEGEGTTFTLDLPKFPPGNEEALK